MKTLTKEEIISIPKWQMIKIEDTLRLANNIHHSQSKETCFDRCICKAWEFACKALDKEYGFKSIEPEGIREELRLFIRELKSVGVCEISIKSRDMIIDKYLKSK